MDSGFRVPKDFVGKVLEGRYKVESLIGEGGMSSVFMADFPERQMKVAVKVMASALCSDPAYIERFKREAVVMNSLDHPNLTRIYAFGILQSGEAYIVLEFLEGETLDDRIDRDGSIPVSKAIPLWRQIGEGVAHAHDGGIIHRDLKPSNIMLVKEQSAEIVKILDFGLAKPGPQSAKQQSVTRNGEVFGSPLYMSPEQCMGKELDFRSDIYAIGCIMYQSLTAQLPFLGDSALATMIKHMQEDPKPLKVAAPNIEVSEPLEKVVFRCLEKNPSKRYQTISELLSDLEAVS